MENITLKQIVDNTPKFKVEIRDDFYYMNKYKAFITSITKSIKRKDKDAIENLIKNLRQQ